MKGFSSMELFTLTYFIILMNLPLVLSKQQTGVHFKMIQSASTETLREERIRCARSAIDHTYAAIRIAEGSGICERLTDAEMASLGIETGFEYFRKKSATEQFKPDVLPYMQPGEELLFYPYVEVKVGDVFQFVLRKVGTVKFYVRFKAANDYVVLSTVARLDEVLLLNTKTTYWEAGKTESYPFSASKEYGLTFEILEAYWQISVDGIVWSQFEHRQSVSTIKEVVVRAYGPNITVSSIKVTTTDP